MVYEFGGFRFDPRERSLVGANGPIRLTRKSADLLLALVRSPGHLVTKDDLIEQVWPGTVAVGDGTITFQIHRLRQTLGDTAASPVYIETVAGSGYRFIHAVIEVPQAVVNHAVAPDPPSIAQPARAEVDPVSPSRDRRRVWIVCALALAAVA